MKFFAVEKKNRSQKKSNKSFKTLCFRRVFFSVAAVTFISGRFIGLVLRRIFLGKGHSAGIKAYSAPTLFFRIVRPLSPFPPPLLLQNCQGERRKENEKHINLLYGKRAVASAVDSKKKQNKTMHSRALYIYMDKLLHRCLMTQ